MPAPIDLYYWPTPNGWKISIALEEMGLDHKIHLTDITKGDQRQPGFLRVSPNGRIPAIVDPDGPDGQPISVFESGAILQYLARKSGRFGGSTPRAQVAVDEWLMWQMGGLGPMAGQAHHFLIFAPRGDPPEVNAYAQARYRAEVARLYKVLDQRLAQTQYVAGAEYTIADMAIFPWVSLYQAQAQSLEAAPHLTRWLDVVAARPAVIRGQGAHLDLRKGGAPDRRGHG